MIRYALSDKAKKLGLPDLVHAKPDDVGYDLCACIDEPVVIPPFSTALIPTGVHVDVTQSDYYPQLFGRSGAGLNGIDVFGGVIDNGYVGEIKAILYNAKNEFVTIMPQNRIAQMVFLLTYRGPLVKINLSDLPQTVRAASGFGSTDSL